MSGEWKPVLEVVSGPCDADLRGLPECGRLPEWWTPEVPFLAVCGGCKAKLETKHVKETNP